MNAWPQRVRILKVVFVSNLIWNKETTYPNKTGELEALLTEMLMVTRSHSGPDTC